MKNISKIIERLLVIVSVVLIAWMSVSWIEITTNDIYKHPTYNDANFFVLCFGE